MLESITLKSVATFDATGIEVTNFKKINFIYGANGCGKTTMTKFIYNPQDIPFANCGLKWENGISIKALVYNKDFRERNFGKGKVDGVFTLGQATKEEIEAIDKMQKELGEIKAEGIKKKETIDKQTEVVKEAENEFRDVAWTEMYKAHEAEFKEAFTGFMKKESFKSKILEEHKNNNEKVLTLDELKGKSQTIFGKVPTLMPAIANIDFTRLLEIEKDKVWKKKIIGKSDVNISKLIQKLNINDWVNEGRSYVLDNSNTCPFCQQETITKSFKTQLEDYFDETFTNDVTVVKSLSEEYLRFSQNILNILQGIESKEKANVETKLNTELFSAYLKTLTSQTNSNKELLNNKTKEPSRSIDLTSTKEQLSNIEKLIASVNREIKAHNDIVNDYAAQREKLIKSIWKYLIEGHKTTIETFIKKVDGLNKGISQLEKQKEELLVKYRALDAKIKDANKNVTSVQPSIDEINRILKSYGFLNFEIVPSSTEANQYHIHRQDGSVAEATLSEGEITFITFLYFLQLAKGSTQQESITDERILVIDDPISSLDSNVLFVVSSLIKEIIKNIRANKGSIKQVILLTHNVYFHKEVSFIDGRTKEYSDTNFWILRRNNNVSSIESYGIKNPIQNSYELLWRELNNAANNSGITVQNIMRRIIENYFKILGKYSDDSLILSFENAQDQEICRSLVSWINDGSHSIPDDLYIEQLDNVIEKYFDVFKRIFVQTGHVEHYNMMYSKAGAVTGA